MTMSLRHLFRMSLATIAMFILSCATTTHTDAPTGQYVAGTGAIDKLQLPAPFATPSVRNTSKVIGWPKGRMPKAAPGFEVSLFADNLDNPRSTYVLPNGDILVVEATREWPDRPDRPEKSANRITLFRDTNKDGKPDLRETFLTGLNMPHGMLLVGNWFYVGNTNGVVRYPYRSGKTKIDGKGEKILDLPAGGHYTRNLIADAGGKKIYVAIGSASNIDEDNQWEKDQRRAGIVEMNPDGSGARIFANGLRNPVGMDWEPETNVLWTVVNERDLLGDDLVPDYLTSVREGAFYGWPFSYFGQNEDPRKKG
jgi:glucose/arabinose dehydrogenase